MNSSSIMKKVLPVIAVIVLILAITLVAGAVKTGSESYPTVSDPDKDYIKISENLNISRGEMYEELKSGIGLSSIITMTNINLMKSEKNEDGKSFFEAVTDEEIEEAMNEAIYGKDADLDTLTEEEKEEKIKEFKNSMYSGYGYKNDAQIEDHYRLTLSMRAYAKSKLVKEVDDEDNDLYIEEETLEEKYEDNYSKSYYAIVIPFASSEQAKLALQQLGVGVSSGKWANQTLDEVQSGSGIFELTTGTSLNTSEVIETFIKLYDIVYGYKGESFVQGEYKIENDTVKVLNGDYVVVDASQLIAQLKEIVQNAKNKFELQSDTTHVQEAKDELAKTTAVIEQIKALVAFVDGLKTIEANIDDVNKALDGEADAKDPLKALDTLLSSIEKFDAKKYIFNTDNEESKLYQSYTALKNYDSVLPSQFKNNYNAYVPYTIGETNATINESSASQSFYSANPYSGTNVYYFLLKIKEVDIKSFESVKDEIKAEIIEEKLTDSYIAEKMAELRADHNFKILDTKLETLYMNQVASYENVKYKKSKKSSKSNVIVTFDDVEITTDDLFKYMDSTSGVATALSELSYRRLVNDSKYNKYYQDGKWVGEEGEELRDTIIASIENQRLYFLAGAYSSYGYDPSTMSWEEFMQNVNGAKDEMDLVFLNLYSKVAGEYLDDAFKFITTDGEGLEVALKSSLEEAKNSPLWQLVSKRMEDALAKKFSVTGVHMLVSVYDTVNESKDSKGTPLDPAKWTDKQKELAVELINDVKAYINCVEGTYEEKLTSVVDAFNACPYAVSEDGKYVPVIDSNGEQYKYYLEACEVKIDLAKYKSAGLSLKVENLGSFTEGKMVESFNDAAKEIWDQDMQDKEYSRITVYKDAIETVYGYHLYVNLSSTEISEYEAKVNEEEVISQVLPTLYEIRLNELIAALEEQKSTISEEDAEALNELIEKTKELLSKEASSAIESYASTIISEITGSYFTSIVQQKDLLESLQTVTINSPSGLTYEDFVKIYEINKETVYKNSLKSLENGDEEAFTGNK